MLNKTRSLLNTLIYQIFFSFAGILAIILAIATVLPNFDARAFNPLKNAERDYFTQESRKTELEYHLDEVFDRGLAVKTPSGFDVILLEPETGQITGMTEKELSVLQAFILKATDPLNPQQSQFNEIELVGPFEVHSPGRRYFQYFSQPVPSQKEFITKLYDSPWLMLIILLLVSMPIIYWQSHRISKPVKELGLTANAVARGDLTENPRLETEGITELRKVGASFNQMIYSLQQLRSYQQRLISDISHELKTPLARMQLALSLLRRRNGDSSEVQRIENEIQKLDQMIQHLLALSRKSLNHHTQRAIFTVNHIWDDVLDDATFEFEASQIQLIITHYIPNKDKYQINGNQPLLASAVENVLRNAKKYAHHQVKLSTLIEARTLCILIDDDGEGVPSDKYAEIFRPFYRIGEDRARQTGGTGLGLAIVADAVEYHHGQVYAEASPLGGLRIKIQLPLWVE